MKFYTYKKATIKNNLPHESFLFFLKSCSLNKMIFKCLLIHYVMIMLMIMILLGCKIVATPLLEECEDDPHTSEMGTWESSGTPKISEFNCRGQNTSP
jgi:hypothetical protein